MEGASDTQRDFTMRVGHACASNGMVGSSWWSLCHRFVKSPMLYNLFMGGVVGMGHR